MARKRKEYKLQYVNLYNWYKFSKSQYTEDEHYILGPKLVDLNNKVSLIETIKSMTINIVPDFSLNQGYIQ